MTRITSFNAHVWHFAMHKASCIHPVRNVAFTMKLHSCFEMYLLTPVFVPPFAALNVITHLPLDKMTAILADDIFKYIFMNENDQILIQISLKLVPMSLIDNKSALVQVMAWRRIGDKPSPEPMITQLICAFQTFLKPSSRHGMNCTTKSGKRKANCDASDICDDSNVTPFDILHLQSCQLMGVEDTVECTWLKIDLNILRPRFCREHFQKHFLNENV